MNILECFLHNYLDILLKLSDGKGWVQQKTQMDCTQMFEFEATPLAIGQGKHVLHKPKASPFHRNLCTEIMLLCLLLVWFMMQMQTIRTYSHTALVSRLFQIETLYYIHINYISSWNNTTKYQGIRNGKIPGGGSSYFLLTKCVL